MSLPVAVLIAGLIVAGVCALLTGLIAIVWSMTPQSTSNRTNALICGLMVPVTLLLFVLFSNANVAPAGFDNLPAVWLAGFFAVVSVPCCLTVSFLTIGRSKRG